MTTATVLNLTALLMGLASAIVLTFSPNPVLDELAKAATPTVVNVGRGGPDVNAIAQLGQRVRAGVVKSRRLVWMGCGGLAAAFILQVVALFV